MRVKLELSGIEFHERVYEGYKKLVEKYPERFISIDPTGTKAETHAKIIESIKDILG